MSTIDSSLGWSCDSDFLFSEAQTLVTFPNGNIIKKNPGAAIVAAWHNNGSPKSYGVTMISPDSSTFAELETDSNNIHVGTVISEVHDGVTWYECDAWNQTPTYAQNESYYTEKLPLLNTSLGHSGAPNAIVTIINESGFEFTVDSGLGWSCDSDYYVDTTGVLGTYGGHTVSKTNAGAAFCVNYKYKDGANPIIYGAAIISTVADYVAATGNMGTESNQYTIDGVTWYKTNIYNVPAATSTMLTDYPLVETTITPQMTTEQQYRLFLQAANVQPTAKKIPTTNYVKVLVEGVEAETAERVNGLSTMIASVFNAQTAYAVDDYCIYNNGLYKCTTAHNGAWSANDFTSVKVMSEIQRIIGMMS